MDIKCSQNELKTSRCGTFSLQGRLIGSTHAQGSTHGVDSCTGVDSWGQLIWCRIEIDSSVSLACIDNKGRPLGSSPLGVLVKNSMPFSPF